MKFVDPKNDVIFKKIFGQHPDILMSFLNSMLPLAPGQEIVELEYLSPEMIPETFLEKFTSVDVHCKDSKGRQFLVEMQMNWTTAFKQRVLFNASKAYVTQTESNPPGMSIFSAGISRLSFASKKNDTNRKECVNAIVGKSMERKWT